MKISNSLSLILNLFQSIHSERIVLQTPLYHITHIVQLFCILSSLSIEYTNLWFNLSSLTCLVPMFVSCRPPSYHTVLCKFYYSPFLSKCVHLAIRLIFLVSLPLLAIHIADLLSNIIRGACYGTTYGSFLNNPLFRILKNW